jgi:hypothetical protein
MKEKTWLKYLIYILVIGGAIFAQQYVNHRFNKQMNETFHVNFYLMYLVQFLFNMLIGFLLGLECLIKEWKKEGYWKINWAELFIMGVPSLFFSIYIYLYFFLQITVMQPLFYLLLEKGSNIIPAFQMILGYIIITSFYKKSEILFKTNQLYF